MADGDALYRCTAGRAGLTAAVGDAEVRVGGALFAAGAEVGVDAGSLVTNGFLKDVPKCAVQTFYLCSGKVVCRSGGVDTGGKKGFIGVHITDTGDKTLVKKSLSGERGAFAELIDRYRNAVYGLLLNRIGDFDQAEDLAQETFVEERRLSVETRPIGRLQEDFLSVAFSVSINAKGA